MSDRDKDKTAAPRRKGEAQPNGERKHREELLDEALEESFPASDAPAVSWPEKKG